MAAREAVELFAAAHDAVGYVLAAVGHVLAANDINFHKVRQRQPFTYLISSKLTISGKKIQITLNHI